MLPGSARRRTAERQVQLRLGAVVFDRGIQRVHLRLDGCLAAIKLDLFWIRGGWERATLSEMLAAVWLLPCLLAFRTDLALDQVVENVVELLDAAVLQASVFLLTCDLQCDSETTGDNCMGHVARRLAAQGPTGQVQEPNRLRQSKHDQEKRKAGAVSGRAMSTASTKRKHRLYIAGMPATNTTALHSHPIFRSDRAARFSLVRAHLFEEQCVEVVAGVQEAHPLLQQRRQLCVVCCGHELLQLHAAALDALAALQRCPGRLPAVHWARFASLGRHGLAVTRELMERNRERERDSRERESRCQVKESATGKKLTEREGRESAQPG